MKFRKKPVVIEAVQWNGDNYEKIIHFVNDTLIDNNKNDGTIRIYTLEGTMTANKNDWIIKGINNEFYPCKPDIFEKTYEKVDDAI